MHFFDETFSSRAAILTLETPPARPICLGLSERFMKHFRRFCVFTTEMQITVSGGRGNLMYGVEKMPPIIEDLRNHSPEQVSELRVLLNSGFLGRPDMRRPGFYEIDGAFNVYYVFRYPSGHKVLLVAAWQKELDPVAEMVACSGTAA
jgi:hypothetical protein